MMDANQDEESCMPCAEVDLGESNDIPSCQGCRRRKLKCSREQPICSHCRRLDAPCEYDLKKNKPGVKLGAVGSLSRRVEVLEAAMLKSQDQTQTIAGSHSHQSTENVVDILSTLARELHKLNSRSRRPSSPGSPEPVTSPTTSHATTTNVDGVEVVSHPHNQSRKRRRVDSCGNPSIDIAPFLKDLDHTPTTLPSSALLEDIITAHFNLIQPWIPILHETRFRRRVHDKLPQLIVVLHAMIVAALRFVDHGEHGLTVAQVEHMVQRSRNFVVLNAMGHLSVESLQALIIVAFTDIGNGEASRTWSIVGSLTRTVEYLQLSVEFDNRNGQPLLKPLPSIAQPRSWTEEEERRRVFWTVFSLDRLCSVTTGWNTSLTADDVQRRLPADGGLWHKEEAVVTPYFGIWDRSAAKIGNSITFLPGHFPTAEKSPDATQATGPNEVDMTTVGAFAYCIEATESLSRVTTYFLRQNIDFKDRQQVSSWLTRFKELDLRLVHWKMFLPQKWRDSNISRQPTLVDMDPNLTLAHLTHNTSMILLHQRIAYPEPEWSNIVKLPSFCSAETCQVAAVESATITQKYLKYKPDHSPVTNQFAFCVFINARVLLVHWRYYAGRLASEFWSLVDSLDEMAIRWVGPAFSSLSTQSLAGKYAKSLRGLHLSCTADPNYVIDVLGYPSPVAISTETPRGELSPDETVLSLKPGLTLPFDDSLGHMQPDPLSGFTPHEVPDGQPDELSAISHLLMDQQFMSMDRIITFDDNIFATSDVGLTW